MDGVDASALEPLLVDVDAHPDDVEDSGVSSVGGLGEELLAFELGCFVNLPSFF